MWVLNESTRDNLLIPYVELYNSKVEKPEEKTNVSQMKQFLLKKFVNEASMRNLSLESNYYLAGVARYYFNGDLTKNKVLNIFDNSITDEFIEEICQRLNALILVLRNAYIDTIGTEFPQPEDFGTLSIKKLLRKYNKAINAELGEEEKKNGEEEEENKLDTSDRVGNGYSFDILYSFNDATRYNKATEPGAWCITYGSGHFEYYTRNLDGHFVVFKKDGYERVKRKKGEGFPRDEYGSSLIAYLQSNTGIAPKQITSRWNHGAGDVDCREGDHAFNKEQFQQITGVSDADLKRIFEIWRANTNEKLKRDALTRKEKNLEMKKVTRILKYAQMLLNEGMSIEEAFKEFAKDKHKNVEDILNTTMLTNSDRASDPNTTPKALRKLMRNSVIGVALNVSEGVDYSFLIDRNKIIFESVVEGKNSFNTYDGLSLIEFSREIGGRMQYTFYDTINHKILNIDGVTKFKVARFNSNSTNNSASRILCIGENNVKWAAIDAETNKPITLPNGRVWSECIKENGDKMYYRSTRYGTETIKRDTSIITFTYDSSARIFYTYDVKSKKFIDIPDGWNVYQYQPRCFGLVMLTDASWQFSEIMFYENGERSKILPGIYAARDKLIYNYYSAFQVKNYIALEDSETRECFIFNTETKEKTEIPFVGGCNKYEIESEKICRSSGVLKYPHSNGIGFILFKRVNNNQYGMRDCPILFFSTAAGRFLKNPLDNSLSFATLRQSYCWGEEELRQVLENCSFLYNPYDDIFYLNKKPYRLNVDGSELVPLYAREEAQSAAVNEMRVKITETDINKMVTESVKRIIRKRLLK